MQNKNYLDKINNLFNNTESITIIVTTIIIITIIVFILVLYNFLSKSNSNCKNIDTNYKNIFNINENNDENDFYTLNKSQDEREIDISFSCTLIAKKNYKIIDEFGSPPANPITNFYVHLEELKLVSGIERIPLGKLTNIIFSNQDGSLVIDNIKTYFNNEIYTVNSNNIFRININSTDFVNQLDTDITEYSDSSQPELNTIKNYFTSISIPNLELYAVEHMDTTLDSNKYYIGVDQTDTYIYIPEELIKIKQSSIKYSYSIVKNADVVSKIDKNSETRDIVLNNNSNIEQTLNKIHNNYILTAFNCCNSKNFKTIM